MIREQCIDTIIVSEASFGDRITWRKWLKSGAMLLGADLLKFVDVLVTWQQRAIQRQQMRLLSDEALKDMGLSRADVAAEVRKIFWRR